MDPKNLKALISLLDDQDKEVFDHVEAQLISMGDSVIPYLENEWENNFNPIVQKRIEELIHTMQFEGLKDKLLEWKNNGFEDLLEGLWLVSTYQYPDLEIATLRKSIEQIYYEVWTSFKEGLHPMDQVKIINDILFNKLKFSPNTKNFHSPSNSMINVVLESRKGNPISLCAIYLLVAQKLELPIYGVNLPNLFVLTYKEDNTQFYINAFNRGLVFSREDIENYITHLNLSKNEMFFQPCSNLSIVVRSLRNLIVSFEKLGDVDKQEEVRQLLEILSPEKH